MTVDEALERELSHATHLAGHSDLTEHEKGLVLLAAEVRRLRALLLEASVDLADWGRYAGEYFVEKHGLAGVVARYRDLAKGTDG